MSRCTSLDTLQIVNFLPSKSVTYASRPCASLLRSLNDMTPSRSPSCHHRVTAHPSVLAWARREGILDLDPDLLDKNQWLNKEVDLGGGMGKGMVIRIGGR